MSHIKKPTENITEKLQFNLMYIDVHINDIDLIFSQAHFIYYLKYSYIKLNIVL